MNTNKPISVLLTNKATGEVKVFPSMNTAAEYLNTGCINVSRAARGITHTVVGHTVKQITFLD